MKCVSRCSGNLVPSTGPHGAKGRSWWGYGSGGMEVTGRRGLKAVQGLVSREPPAVPR